MRAEQQTSLGLLIRICQQLLLTGNLRHPPKVALRGQGMLWITDISISIFPVASNAQWYLTYLFPRGWLTGKEAACLCRRHSFQSWVEKSPLEKRIATHSSVLAWRIPWTEELGGLQSVGSHRVEHNWSGWATTANNIRAPLMCGTIPLSWDKAWTRFQWQESWNSKMEASFYRTHGWGGSPLRFDSRCGSTYFSVSSCGLTGFHWGNVDKCSSLERKNKNV